MTKETLNELAKAAYENAKAKGFYDKPVNFPERIALIHAELSEALEADRAGKRFEGGKYLGLNITTDDAQKMQAKYFKDWYGAVVKGTIEEELSDVVIRILDLAGHDKHEFTGDLDLAGFNPKVNTGTPGVLAASHYQVSRALMEWIIEEEYWWNLETTLDYLWTLSQKLGIDLETHIRLKIRYNSIRPEMHGGKKY